jgi:hypothetical protein
MFETCHDLHKKPPRPPAQYAARREGTLASERVAQTDGKLGDIVITHGCQAGRQAGVPAAPPEPALVSLRNCVSDE